MGDIKQLITEYAAITGRPVATISVSEFLELKSYAEKGNVTPISTQYAEPVISKPASVPEPEPQVIPMPEPSKEKAVELDDEPKKTEKKPISSAFMMMRSIGS